MTNGWSTYDVKRSRVSGRITCWVGNGACWRIARQMDNVTEAREWIARAERAGLVRKSKPLTTAQGVVR